MKNESLSSIIITHIVISSFVLASVNAQVIKKDAEGNEYLADRLIVKMKGVSTQGKALGEAKARWLKEPVEAGPQIQQLVGKWGVTKSKALFPRIRPLSDNVRNRLSTVKAAKKEREFAKLGNTFVLSLASGSDVERATVEFAQDEKVEYAEPVYVFRLCVIPNDPLFDQQWYLHNTGQYFLADADIDAPEAWDINQGSANPVIAVIDTGVDLDHPDLVNQIWQNPVEQPGDDNGDGYPGWQGFDDDADGLIDEDSAGRQPGDPGYNNDLINDDDENGYNDDFNGWNWIDDHNDPQDDHGHGTHCAGIAAAETDNGIGIAGVCPNGQIMALNGDEHSK